jgi:O-antigen ligase
VTWNAAHNLYLELFADLGIVAVAPLLAVILLVARSARAIFNPRVDWVAPAATVTISVIAAVHSLVDFSLQIEAIVMMFVSVLGAGTAQSWIATSSASSRTTAGGMERGVSLKEARNA